MGQSALRFEVHLLGQICLQALVDGAHIASEHGDLQHLERVIGLLDGLVLVEASDRLLVFHAVGLVQ